MPKKILYVAESSSSSFCVHPNTVGDREVIAKIEIITRELHTRLVKMPEKRFDLLEKNKDQLSFSNKR